MASKTQDLRGGLRLAADGLAVLAEAALAGIGLRRPWRRDAPCETELQRASHSWERGVAALVDFRTGVRIPITGSVLTVGRDARNDLILPAATVSAQHANIEGREGKFCVVDLGSTNGTFVNGRRTTGATPLEDGDRIEFDEFRFQFVSSGAGAGAPERHEPVLRTIIREGPAAVCAGDQERSGPARPRHESLESFAGIHEIVICDRHGDRRAVCRCARCDRACCDDCVAATGAGPLCAECAGPTAAD